MCKHWDTELLQSATIFSPLNNSVNCRKEAPARILTMSTIAFGYTLTSHKKSILGPLYGCAIGKIIDREAERGQISSTTPRCISVSMYLTCYFRTIL